MLYYTYIILFGFGQLCFRTSFLDNPFSLYTIFIIIRIGSRNFAGSWVELFLVIVNGFQPFALVMKSSILDLARLLHIWTTASIHKNGATVKNVKRCQSVKNACAVTKFRQLRHFI